MTETREVKRLFEAIVADGEPQSGPDLPAIISTGDRRRRRRRTLTTAAAACLAALAVLGVNRLQDTSSPGGGASVSPEVAGGASAPAPPPHDLSPENQDKVHAALQQALSARLPKGLRLESGPAGSTTFRLIRDDGTTTTITTVKGFQDLDGIDNPCVGRPGNTGCERVELQDGSRGWAFESAAGQLPGWSVSVTVATMDGHVWGITDSAAYATDIGTPLSKQQLIALAADPLVTATLKQVPTDEVTPAPPDVPRKA